jgi:hypothetical protein
MNITSVAIESVWPDPDNARLHPQRNLDAIKESLRRFGQQKPIVISSEGVILAGNGTHAGAKELGWRTIEAVVSKLEGTDAVAYALTDNRTSDLSTWDPDSIGPVLSRLLGDSSIALAPLGWFDKEVSDLIGGFVDDESVIPDYDADSETVVVQIENVLIGDVDDVLSCVMTSLDDAGIEYAKAESNAD